MRVPTICSLEVLHLRRMVRPCARAIAMTRSATRSARHCRARVLRAVRENERAHMKARPWPLRGYPLWVVALAAAALLPGTRVLGQTTPAAYTTGYRYNLGGQQTAKIVPISGGIRSRCRL